MKVLIVDDQPEICETLAARLRENGFTVEAAQTGKDGAEMALLNRYDILVLDLNLPDISGEEVVARVRRSSQVPPILMMTVTSDVDSKIRLLDAGADDYVVKPFSFGEFLARVRALVRRPSVQVLEKLTVSNLELNSRTRVVTRGKKQLQLTRTEFDILERLMRQEGAVISKGELIEQVWDSTADPFSSSFDTHLGNLRRKIGSPELIHTVHRSGYKIG